MHISCTSFSIHVQECSIGQRQVLNVQPLIRYMALDSKAAFQTRALEVGISQTDVDALAVGGVETYSQYAFCTSYQPGGASDSILFDHLETILGARPTAASASNFRRLFFESHSMALKDLQSRLERSDTSEVKILPLAEKAQRVEDLRRRLPGVMLSSSLEPSHTLIDKAVHQFEENCVKLIELTQCTSRESEIQNEKTMPQLTFDASGNIKVTKHQATTECSISGDIRLRGAFTRRSLAYDLAGVATYEAVESWSQLLFDRMCLEPPPGYKHMSVDQAIRADRKLWTKVSELTRAKVTGVTSDGKKNVDVAIQELAHHPEVQFLMMPLPMHSGSSQASSSGAAATGAAARYQPYPTETPKGKGKHQTKAGGKQSKGKISIPEGCGIRFGDGDSKPICMKFNLGRCGANIKAGKRCQHGYHVCWKKNCNRPFPFHECPHSGGA